jgi:histidinol-phosphate phosphatase family protein
MISILTPQGVATECHPALFLDRDDTLMVNCPYLSDPSRVALFAGAVEGLRRFREAGWRLIVVSNQSGLARGYFTREQLSAVTDRLAELLAAGGVVLDAIYYCPHGPDDGCDCRKPRLGMIEAACRDFAIDLAKSWMVGDKAADLELAQNAHLHAAQFLPKEDSQLLPGAEFAVRSMTELASRILG